MGACLVHPTYIPMINRITSFREQREFLPHFSIFPQFITTLAGILVAFCSYL